MPGKGKIAFFAILQKTQEIKGIIRTDDFLNKIEVFSIFWVFSKNRQNFDHRRKIIEKIVDHDFLEKISIV